MPQAFQDAHEVFTEDFPECAFVTMRELRAKEIPARECVGKEWDDSRLREHQSWQDNKVYVRRRRSDLPRGTKVRTLGLHAKAGWYGEESFDCSWRPRSTP